MVKVTFTSHNKEIYCNKGDKLLDVARNADIFIDAPCNGNVSCGKCKVRLIKGKVDTEKTHHIKDEEWNQGYILACNTKVIEDIDIEVPSKLSSSMYGMKIEGSDNRKDKEVFDRAKKIIKENNFKFETNIEKTYIELDEPTLDDNISDIDRIERHIRNSLGYNEIDFTIDLLRKVPTVIRKDNFKVTITYIKKKNKITILNIESGNTENKLYGVAIDIGTTSVVVCLVDLYTKEILDKASSGNAQIKYGADVIHRIVYSTKKNGLKELNEAIVEETINPLLNSIYTKHNIDKDNVVSLVVSGNTTMSSLFLGVYADFLRQEPFIPPFLKSPKLIGKDVRLNINDSAQVFLSPSVASYLGGDITAGVLSSGIWSSEENVLFIDLGTNGEIVFGNKDYKELFDSISGNKFTRVNSLYNDIYGYDLYKNMELRYQLLTATEGILKEAKKANASKAVLLVITLKKEGCYSEKKVEANLQDLKNFVTSLGTPLEDGQYNLPVYPDIDFYVEHVEVEV